MNETLHFQWFHMPLSIFEKCSIDNTKEELFMKKVKLQYHQLNGRYIIGFW